MSTYRKYDWPRLFKAFEESQLTQTAFCQEHNLNPKYFSQRQKRFVQECHGLTKVEIAKPESLVSNMMIEYGQCRIHCSAGTAVKEITQLLRSLSHD